jgi:hypothetical protein
MKTILILSFIFMITLAGCTVTQPMENGPYTESRFIPAPGYNLMYDNYNDPFYNNRYNSSNTYYYNGRYYTRPSYSPAYTVPVYPTPRQTDRDTRYRSYDRQERHDRYDRRSNQQGTPGVFKKNAPWKS